MRNSILIVCTLMFATAAGAQTAAPGTQPNMSQQLQNIMSSKKGQSNIGQVLAIGTLLGCTQKLAGKEATQAFYQEMNTVGKTVEGYCKQGHPTEARALILSTLDAKRTDPTLLAALTCYDTQKENLDKLAGPQAAADAARYARWAHDPDAAKKEMAETDICKNTKHAEGKSNEL